MEIHPKEIEISQLIGILYKKKWLILGGTLLSTALAIFISFILPPLYQSTGFFQLSGVSTPAYKTYASLLTNPHHFHEFVTTNPRFPNNLPPNLNGLISTTHDLEQSLDPVYAFTAEDKRELAQLGQNKENFVVGIRVNSQASTPEYARDCSHILGEYIKDCILFSKLNNFITTSLNSSQTQVKHTDNLIIQNEFKLLQIQSKLHDIKQIQIKYPQSKNIPNRELVSVDKGGYRYLSPVTQLVGIESQIADLKQTLSTNRRNKDLMELRLEFFTAAKTILDKEIFGKNLMIKVLELKDKIFKEKDLTQDTVLEVQNDLFIDFDNFAMFEEKMQFVSGPTLPDQTAHPKKPLIIGLTFLMAIFCFVLLVFVLEWWGKNRLKVLDIK